jgi:hypothetical protein
VLPFNNRVGAEVSYIGNTRADSGFEEHPAKVSPEETFVGIVRVEISVRVAMVSTVLDAPPFD